MGAFDQGVFQVAAGTVAAESGVYSAAERGQEVEVAE